MSKTKKPESQANSIAVSTMLMASTLAVTAYAHENPFEFSDLDSGYMIAESSHNEGQKMPDTNVKREGSGKGCNKLADGKCGEGTCGTSSANDCEENLSGSKGNNKLGEGKCGEGACGTQELSK